MTCHCDQPVQHAGVSSAFLSPGTRRWSAPRQWSPTVSTVGKIGVRTVGTGGKIDETAHPSPLAHRDLVPAISRSKAVSRHTAFGVHPGQGLLDQMEHRIDTILSNVVVIGSRNPICASPRQGRSPHCDRVVPTAGPAFPLGAAFLHGALWPPRSPRSDEASWWTIAA